MSTTTSLGTFRGVGDVRLIARQVRYEQLGFWLNPVAAVFTIGFSLVFLVLLASTAGNARFTQYGDIREVQYYLPGFAAYGVMSACFNMLTITLVVRREMGLLKRMRLSPLPTWVMMAAVFVNSLIISLVQVVVLLVIGRFGYHVVVPRDLGAVALVVVVGVFCFTSLGIATSTLIPNQEAAGPVVGIIFFVLLFLAGLWYPIKSSSGLGQFSSYLPVRHMILAVFATFNAGPGRYVWPWHDLLYMVGWGVVGIAVSLRRWSWAPRRSDPGRSLRSPLARRH